MGLPVPNANLSETAYFRAHFAAARAAGSHPMDEKIDRILAILRLRPGERVLDVGSGLGDLAAAMSACGAEVVGVDASREGTEAARQHYPAVRYEVVNGTELDQRFDAGTFDAVTCVQVLEHVPPDDVDLFIKQLAMVLRVGGRLLVEVPVTENLSDQWLMIRNRYLRGMPRPPGAIDSSFNPTHRWRVGSLEALIARFEAEHLAPVQVQRVYYVPWLLERLGIGWLAGLLPSPCLDQLLKGARILFRKDTPGQVLETVEFSAFWTDPPGTRGAARLKKVCA